MREAADAAGQAQYASRPPKSSIDWLAWLGGLFSAALIVVILSITIVSVVMRYLLNRPLLGGDEATGFLVVATVMFGAAEALRRGDHIGIDLLTGVAPPRVKHWLGLLAHVAVLVFAVVLFVSAWRSVAFSLSFGAYSTGHLEIPIWIPQSTMLAGAFLLGFVALTRLLLQLRGGAAP